LGERKPCPRGKRRKRGRRKKILRRGKKKGEGNWGLVLKGMKEGERLEGARSCPRVEVVGDERNHIHYGQAWGKHKLPKLSWEKEGIRPPRRESSCLQKRRNPA